ncbi:hypothetical protein RF11_09394 [Thelohanellus kitauei]|uniref:Uncharacterized protein n=1 Tax=Thelohanellus kitauei TaxID=669202 RepID=A0A0C2IYZ8_THEKT|nr:hypothetical protein RF11_09394 [Thelohanellus kitauei]
MVLISFVVHCSLNNSNASLPKPPTLATVRSGVKAITMNPEPAGCQYQSGVADGVSGERENEFVPCQHANEWELRTSRRGFRGSLLDISDNLLQECLLCSQALLDFLLSLSILVL